MCRSRPGMKGSLNVVVVEDDADYAFFIEQAFRNRGFANLVMICGDGEEAVDYLDGKGEFVDGNKITIEFGEALDFDHAREN